MAILVSALVCPGAGQMMLGRVVTGIVLLTGFLLALGWGFYRFVRLFMDLFAGEVPGEASTPWEVMGPVLIPLGVAVLIYLANLVDILIPRRTGKPSPP